MRQTTMDESGRRGKNDTHLGTSVDSGNENFPSGVENEGESREKGLPTIFKYQGQGKEVYVCGKSTSWGLLVEAVVYKIISLGD